MSPPPPADAPRFDPRALFSVAAALILGRVFMPHALATPFVYLATFFHEAGHALAALATGGVVESFEVQLAGGGLTRATGGFDPAVFAGGYLGTALAGAGFLLVNRFPRLRVPALALTGLGILALSFGLGTGLLTYGLGLTVGAGLIGLALTDEPELHFHSLTFLGVMVGTHAVGDLLGLIATSLGLKAFLAPEGLGHAMTDADQMARATGYPAALWAAAWTAASLAALGLAAWVLCRAPRRAAPAGPTG